MLKLLNFFVFLALLMGCGIQPDSASQLAMVGGRDVREGSPAFRATLALVRKGPKGFEAACSGTLIAPRLVLTSAHCVENFTQPTEFWVLFGQDEADPKAETRAVQDFASYRPQDGARFFPNFDIAWVKLADDAPAGYEPVEILRDAEQLQTLLNQTDAVTLAGFGRNKTHCESPDSNCSGRRLEVQSFLRRYVRSAHFAELLIIGPKPHYGSCHGDSGGPAFAQLHGRWYLLGNLNGKNLALNSPAVWDVAQICESGEAIYTFAGAYLDWLQQSSGVSLSFDSKLNPKGAGPLPVDGPEAVRGASDLAGLLAYYNPDDPLWVTAEALMQSFGDEDKRTISGLGEVVTDPERAAASMQSWTSFRYTGVAFDVGTFELKDRQLSVLHPITLLKNLQKLELIGNRFDDVSALGRLEQLRELTLSENYDFQTNTKLPYDFGFLRHLTRLRVLNLAGNSGNLDLRSIPWESLRQLEVLDLSANDTLDLKQVRFESMPRLHTLMISNAGLTHIEALARAPGLRSLDLRGNSIQDISVLAKLPQLQILDVSQNQIEDFSSVAALRELKSLKAMANPLRIKVCPERRAHSAPPPRWFHP